MARRRSPLGTAAAMLVVAVALAGCGLVGGPSSGVAFEESGVRVEIAYAGGERGEVTAVFRPLEPGFHLYGPELPRDGNDGAGRPTLLEVTAGSAWREAGPLRAEPDTILQTLPAFDEPFPIFPDGPVTLRLAVERGAPAVSEGLSVSVTYMACSSAGLCLAPVIDRTVEVATLR